MFFGLFPANMRKLPVNRALSRKFFAIQVCAKLQAQPDLALVYQHSNPIVQTELNGIKGSGRWSSGTAEFEVMAFMEMTFLVEMIVN